MLLKSYIVQCVLLLKLFTACSNVQTEPRKEKQTGWLAVQKRVATVHARTESFAIPNMSLPDRPILFCQQNVEPLNVAAGGPFDRRVWQRRLLLDVLSVDVHLVLWYIVSGILYTRLRDDDIYYILEFDYNYRIYTEC